MRNKLEKKINENWSFRKVSDQKWLKAQVPGCVHTDLHFNNIIMGTYETFWPRPLPQNPKGFYENYDFRKINDAILIDSGYRVKSYKTIIPIPKVSKRAKMIKTIKNCSVSSADGKKLSLSITLECDNMLPNPPISSKLIM